MNRDDELRNSWASLGSAFYLKSKKIYSPEEAILLLVKSSEFPEDKKMMSMALTWLKHFSRFVHIERLQNMSKDLGSKEMALLGAISLKCVGLGDQRWKKLAKFAAQAISKTKLKFPEDDEYLLSTKGRDKEFERFKIRVTPIELESEKKFLTRERMLAENPWLRFRLLFGVNLRADVATVIYLKLATTAYAAAKYLNFSTSAVYRNWDDLKKSKWDEVSLKL